MLALLADARLVTLVGPGGVGKTRLAAEVAAGWQAPDGVWLAELAGITDPAEVPAAVCAALGCGPPRRSWPRNSPAGSC